MTKKIGFLSFGHYRDVPGSRVRTAGDSLRQHIDLAVAAEAAGLDGAWVRVHHFDHSLGAPFPLLSAMAARTSTIDVGTGVVDLRYENPLYMAEEAGATDLISAGRLQLGISRGSPEPAADGQAAFGYRLAEGEDWSSVTRARAELFRRAIGGRPVARSQRALARGGAPDLPIQPLSPGLPNRIWWGAGTHATGVWAGEQGYNLLSSTLLLADDGRPFHLQQADQVRAYRAALAESGLTTGGQAAVTRSAFPITTAEDQSVLRAGPRRHGLRGHPGRAAGPVRPHVRRQHRRGGVRAGRRPGGAGGRLRAVRAAVHAGRRLQRPPVREPGRGGP